MPYHLYFRRFGDEGAPVIQKTVPAKKRYTFIPLFQTIWGLRSPRHSENHASQKTVYLNYFVSDDVEARSPRHSENHSSQKTLYLNRSRCLLRVGHSGSVLSKPKGKQPYKPPSPPPWPRYIYTWYIYFFLFRNQNDFQTTIWGVKDALSFRNYFKAF